MVLGCSAIFFRGLPPDFCGFYHTDNPSTSGRFRMMAAQGQGSRLVPTAILAPNNGKDATAAEVVPLIGIDAAMAIFASHRGTRA